MTDITREQELKALHTEIANLREAIVALATGVKQFADTPAAGPQAGGEHDASAQGTSANGTHDTWTDLQHTLDSARAHGEKAVKELAVEIERQPLLASLAAFGLGFFIARLWYRGSKP